MTDWKAISTAITRVSKQDFAAESYQRLGGGSINEAWKISDSHSQFFVKLNSPDRLTMFEAEAEGLAELALAKAIRVPTAICYGQTEAQSYLVLEHIEFGHSINMAGFGEQLALMHRHTADQFGWHRSNTIGSTQQINDCNTDWINFWRTQRLGFQLDLARNNGHTGPFLARGEKLMELLPAFFTGYQPVPSLLHGDLWSGNYTMDSVGEPVIFDPAVYYGDREADIAMTELFGGFSSDFYRGYRHAWSLDAGYSTRKHLYNLYHILNHLNLFGGGYRHQAESMIHQLLAEVAG